MNKPSPPTSLPQCRVKRMRNGLPDSGGLADIRLVAEH